MPQRIQRKRTKGWRMPPNTIYVGRGTRWGNPYRVGESQTRSPGALRPNADWEHEGRCDKANHQEHTFTHADGRVTRHYVQPATPDQCVEMYAQHIGAAANTRLNISPDEQWCQEYQARARQELAGKNLACWCPPDQPCHADVLLEIANQGDNQ